MKAEGVGELALCGVGAAVTKPTHCATVVRVRDRSITLDTARADGTAGAASSERDPQGEKEWAIWRSSFKVALKSVSPATPPKPK